MRDLWPVTLADMIAEVERELSLRRSVYPRQIAQRRMTKAAADRHIQVMDVVLQKLRTLDVAEW